MTTIQIQIYFVQDDPDVGSPINDSPIVSVPPIRRMPIHTFQHLFGGDLAFGALPVIPCVMTPGDDLLSIGLTDS